MDPQLAALLPWVINSGNASLLAPGELLRAVRRATLRMTQAQLAQRSGIDQAHIARMEGGNVGKQWKSWQHLFEVMGCHLVWRAQAEGGLKKIV